MMFCRVAKLLARPFRGRLNRMTPQPRRQPADRAVDPDLSPRHRHLSELPISPPLLRQAYTTCRLGLGEQLKLRSVSDHSGRKQDAALGLPGSFDPDTGHDAKATMSPPKGRCRVWRAQDPGPAGVAGRSSLIGGRPALACLETGQGRHQKPGGPFPNRRSLRANQTCLFSASSSSSPCLLPTSPSSSGPMTQHHPLAGQTQRAGKPSDYARRYQIHHR